MRPWILAARPKTLVAGLIPVALGSALAFHQGGFHAPVFFAALFAALAIQIGTNYVNDAADFERGADTSERLGPARMAASGLLTPRALYLGSAACFFIAFLFGIYLIAVAGWPILAIGLTSILFAVAYTAGPFPLAYLGLGDLFVLIFFGLVAVLGTVYAHTQLLDRDSLYVALATGFHAVCLIAVNNLRDIPTDLQAGKRTLAVRMGDRAARAYVTILAFLPYFCWMPVGVSLHGFWPLAPFLSLPIAINNSRAVFAIQDRREFNELLGRSAGLQLAFGLLATLALVFGT